MCGIAGYYQATKSRVLPEMVERMTSSLRHRGPEGQGMYHAPSGLVCFGHRRLAFLDLNPTGDQPMLDATGQHALIFNGEIYNYRELREELKARGIHFRSTGDSEVLLQMLIQHGDAALPRLRGMFALAYWNETQQELLLARDRFGIKPLVYTDTADGVAFASEIRALQEVGLASQKLNPAAFLYYLLWGSIAPTFTWLQGVQSLEPGSWQRYRLGKPTERGIFADIRQIYTTTHPVPQISEADFKRKVGETVEESVKLHLESDVPVGVFLSGGIDSSSLVSAVKEVSTNQVRTYTITFEEDHFSEESIAREVASHFETDHHVCRITAHHFLKDWQTIFSHYDQPTLDAFNSFYVSKVVAETGLKGVLSGTGGDEFFGGYPSFRWMPKVQSKARLLRWLGPLLHNMQKPQRRAKWKHLCRAAHNPLESFRAIRGLFMPHEIPAIAGPALLDRLPEIQPQVDHLEHQWLSGIGREQLPATVSRLETRQYLSAQLLRDIDVMSMAHSLEVRVPLIDHVLAETL